LQVKFSLDLSNAWRLEVCDSDVTISVGFDEVQLDDAAMIPVENSPVFSYFFSYELDELSIE